LLDLALPSFDYTIAYRLAFTLLNLRGRAFLKPSRGRLLLKFDGFDKKPRNGMISFL